MSRVVTLRYVAASSATCMQSFKAQLPPHGAQSLGVNRHIGAKPHLQFQLDQLFAFHAYVSTRLMDLDKQQEKIVTKSVDKTPGIAAKRGIP